jgi:hypothetical protein
MKLVDEDLLREFRAKRKCEHCRRVVSGCDPHHIFCRGMGGGGRIDHPYNLVGLCRECHCRVHAGQLERKHLLAIVAEREGITEPQAVQLLMDLRRSHDQSRS